MEDPIKEKNLNYMCERLSIYCMRVSACTSCLVGRALTEATGAHHRCGNGFGWIRGPGRMNEDEIRIAYQAAFFEGGNLNEN